MQKSERTIDNVLDSLLNNLNNEQCLEDQSALIAMNNQDPNLCAQKIDEYVNQLAEQMPGLTDEMKEEFKQSFSEGLKNIAKGEPRQEWTKTIGEVSKKLYGIDADKQQVTDLKKDMVSQIKQDNIKIEGNKATIALSLKQNEELGYKIALGVAGNPGGTQIRWSPPLNNTVIIVADLGGDLDANSIQASLEKNVNEVFDGISNNNTNQDNLEQERSQTYGNNPRREFGVAPEPSPTSKLDEAKDNIISAKEAGEMSLKKQNEQTPDVGMEYKSPTPSPFDMRNR